MICRLHEYHTENRIQRTYLGKTRYEMVSKRLDRTRWCIGRRTCQQFIFLEILNNSEDRILDILGTRSVSGPPLLHEVIKIVKVSLRVAVIGGNSVSKFPFADLS